MRRRVTGWRPRRGRAAGSGRLLFGRSLVAGEGWLGAGRVQKEKFGLGRKKAQNGIKTKNISTTISAGFQKKNSLVPCLL